MEVTVNSATLYQGSFNVDEELGSLNLGYIAQGSPGLADRRVVRLGGLALPGVRDAAQKRRCRNAAARGG